MQKKEGNEGATQKRSVPRPAPHRRLFGQKDLLSRRSQVGEKGGRRKERTCAPHRKDNNVSRGKAVLLCIIRVPALNGRFK